MTTRPSQGRAPTLKDVAALARVSTKTVSRVLNGVAGVAPSTREQVLNAVKALGYRVNGVARALVTGRTGLYGLVVADVENPFFSRLVRGAEEEAASAGEMVVVFNTDERPERELRAIGLLIEKQVDAILIAASRLSSQELLEVARRGTPVVVINRVLRAAGIASVVTDDYAAMYSVIAHLYAGGYSHPAYLAGPDTSFAARVRAKAFRHHLLRFFPSEPVRIVQGLAPTLQGGKAGVHRLMSTWPEVDAICTYNDLMAVGALEALRELGLSVPDRVGVVGYDGIPLTEMTHPPLTTVQQHPYELGAHAMALARRLVEGSLPPEAALVNLTASLVIRQSTRADGNRVAPQVAPPKWGEE